MTLCCTHFETRTETSEDLWCWRKGKGQDLNWWILLFTMNSRNGLDSGCLGIWKYASFRSTENTVSLSNGVQEDVTVFNLNFESATKALSGNRSMTRPPSTRNSLLWKAGTWSWTIPIASFSSLLSTSWRSAWLLQTLSCLKDTTSFVKSEEGDTEMVHISSCRESKGPMLSSECLPILALNTSHWWCLDPSWWVSNLSPCGLGWNRRISSAAVPRWASPCRYQKCLE